MSDSVDIRALDVPRDGIPELVNADIDAAVEALRAGHGPFAIDTERAMGIRYSARAYLIQIRREGVGTFLLDPVGIEDRLDGLAEVLATDTWILHAADQDLPCLRELGLEAPEVFDTEIAGILLGFERVSLQAMVAEVLGYGLAKEHAMSDWSERPLAPELLAYAALDVELLIELREKLIGMLKTAGRLEWVYEECEEIRLREPKPPRQQPWRKSARQVGVKDRRSLAMLEALWKARDGLARERDIAPEKVLPSKLLGTLALHKPRSHADVVRSPLLQSRTRRKDADAWWDAISPVWSMPTADLPERYFNESTDPFPATRTWSKANPDAAKRWDVVRSTVLARADDLGIRQELLLRPIIQKTLAWDGWDHADDIPVLLAALGARPWQVENVASVIAAAVKRANL